MKLYIHNKDKFEAVELSSEYEVYLYSKLFKPIYDKWNLNTWYCMKTNISKNRSINDHLSGNEHIIGTTIASMLYLTQEECTFTKYFIELDKIFNQKLMSLNDIFKKHGSVLVNSSHGFCHTSHLNLENYTITDINEDDFAQWLMFGKYKPHLHFKITKSILVLENDNVVDSYISNYLNGTEYDSITSFTTVVQNKGIDNFIRDIVYTIKHGILNKIFFKTNSLNINFIRILIREFDVQYSRTDNRYPTTIRFFIHCNEEDRELFKFNTKDVVVEFI